MDNNNTVCRSPEPAPIVCGSRIRELRLEDEDEVGDRSGGGGGRRRRFVDRSRTRRLNPSARGNQISKPG